MEILTLDVAVLCWDRVSGSAALLDLLDVDDEHVRAIIPGLGHCIKVLGCKLLRAQKRDFFFVALKHAKKESLLGGEMLVLT